MAHTLVSSWVPFGVEEKELIVVSAMDVSFDNMPKKGIRIPDRIREMITSSLSWNLDPHASGIGSMNESTLDIPHLYHFGPTSDILIEVQYCLIIIFNTDQHTATLFVGYRRSPPVPWPHPEGLP